MRSKGQMTLEQQNLRCCSRKVAHKHIMNYIVLLFFLNVNGSSAQKSLNLFQINKINILNYIEKKFKVLKIS